MFKRIPSYSRSYIIKTEKKKNYPLKLLLVAKKKKPPILNKPAVYDTGQLVLSSLYM